jgi:hypothetical protein
MGYFLNHLHSYISQELLATILQTQKEKTMEKHMVFFAFGSSATFMCDPYV